MEENPRRIGRRGSTRRCRDYCPGARTLAVIYPDHGRKADRAKRFTKGGRTLHRNNGRNSSSNNTKTSSSSVANLLPTRNNSHRILANQMCSEPRHGQLYVDSQGMVQK